MMKKVCIHGPMVVLLHVHACSARFLPDTPATRVEPSPSRNEIQHWQQSTSPTRNTSQCPRNETHQWDYTRSTKLKYIPAVPM